MKYYIVEYRGQFGFIKPWTAVRDSETFSQQFLTPSMVMGIERKLFPELLASEPKIHKIQRHRLAYAQMDAQQEQTISRGWNKKKNGEIRLKSILTRYVLLEPKLFLAFSTLEEAEHAFQQHICLARNEDILLPYKIHQSNESEFDSSFTGYELIFERTDQSFLVGYNRYDDAAPMYGWLKVVGNPVKSF